MRRSARSRQLDEYVTFGDDSHPLEPPYFAAQILWLHLRLNSTWTRYSATMTSNDGLTDISLPIRPKFRKYGITTIRLDFVAYTSR